MQRTGTILATVAHLALLGSIGIPILTTIVVLTATGVATLVVLVGFLLLALAALALLGMVARGETRIADAWQIERGYNDFARKAHELGANLAYTNAC